MKSVLIVDDAAFMRLALKTVLEKNGFEVVGEAENGVEAVKMYNQLKPDIVTMDITMPDMGGVEALIAIRGINSDATVVMITAMGQQTHVKEAVLNGAKGFIVKPWKEETVLEVLTKV
jgi:two-component system chemotaxis response regulator CheY